MGTTQVAVIGAGIAGLSAAAALADAGVDVTVLEAGERCGGQIRRVEFGGRTVDVGAEALHLAAPGVAELLCRAGVEGDVVRAAIAPTLVATPRGLRPLPAGLGPAGPTRLWPVATSGILGPLGLLRAAAEPLVPGRPPEQDVSVGDYLAGRFGRRLVDRLIDPLLGNLHAADVDTLSLAAAAPHLDALARSDRSLVLGRRRRAGGDGGGPSFVTLRGGLASLVDALAADPRIDVRCGRPVVSLDHSGDRYRVIDVAEGAMACDAIVLAVPAQVASRLLQPSDPAASRVLGGAAAAATSDDEVVERAHADLAQLTGVAEPPVHWHVQRWPMTMPQLEVGHRARLAEVRRLTQRHRLRLAGAAMDGVGVTSAAASGRAAAQGLLETIPVGEVVA